MQSQTLPGPQESIRRLLSDIEDFCRSSDMAESTLAVRLSMMESCANACALAKA